MDKPINFEARDQNIEKVLFGTEKFKIPRFQRPYTWTEDNISDFWNDLITNDQPFFIGSLIFNHEPLAETGFIDIIDGQQRLLTITIFIAVLRDIAKTIDKELAKRFQRQDIAIEDRQGNSTYRLIPGDSAKDFFLTNIQRPEANIKDSKPTTIEEERIKNNYLFLFTKTNEEISKYQDNSSKVKLLNDLRSKVSKLVVIYVQIESEEDAYEIFETTNARGVDLSIADLLKNLIFKKMPEQETRDIAKDAWNDICNNVESTNTELKKFLRYYWISKFSFVPEKKLFREIKNKITKWEDFLNSIWTNSELYNSLLELNEDDWKEIKNGSKIFKSLQAIELMNVSQCYVLFLSILRNYDHLFTDPTRVFHTIEKFTFLYSAICKMPGNRLEKIYSSYARKLEETLTENQPFDQSNAKKIAAKVNSIFDNLINELKQEKPTKDFFIGSFNDFSYGRSEKNRKLIKYVLSEINYINSTGEHKIDFDRVNIEHLLPQKPSKKWGLTKKQIKNYVNKLGNLTLLSKRLNSTVSNKIIEDKIDELSKSEIAITKKLVDDLRSSNYKWGEDEINSRHLELAEISYDKIWNF